MPTTPLTSVELDELTSGISNIAARREITDRLRRLNDMAEGRGNLTTAEFVHDRLHASLMQSDIPKKEIEKIMKRADQLEASALEHHKGETKELNEIQVMYNDLQKKRQQAGGLDAQEEYEALRKIEQKFSTMQFGFTITDENGKKIDHNGLEREMHDAREKMTSAEYRDQRYNTKRAEYDKDRMAEYNQRINGLAEGVRTGAYHIVGPVTDTPESVIIGHAIGPMKETSDLSVTLEDGKKYRIVTPDGKDVSGLVGSIVAEAAGEKIILDQGAALSKLTQAANQSIASGNKALGLDDPKLSGLGLPRKPDSKMTPQELAWVQKARAASAARDNRDNQREGDFPKNVPTTDAPAVSPSIAALPEDVIPQEIARMDNAKKAASADLLVRLEAFAKSTDPREQDIACFSASLLETDAKHNPKAPTLENAALLAAKDAAREVQTGDHKIALQDFDKAVAGLPEKVRLSQDGQNKNGWSRT